MNSTNLDFRCINAIRMLSADAIQKANSGHPGLPMGAAPMAYVLWKKHMQYSPKNPYWENRDRFILSAGHGSMLQYALLFLTGYASPTLEDIKQFRQWGSLTPGHPENTTTPGVEVTTGPLGQGFANAVGMACAEAHLAAKFNKSDCSIVDHRTYCIVGDGCLMEGISAEAASLAGHLGLGKLTVLYDDNKITIDGSTDITFTEDITKRFEAYNWQVLSIKDGDNDLEGISSAFEMAKAETQKPTLIRVHTTIGYGSPNKAGTSAAHGAPLGNDEIDATRKALGYELKPFEVPSDVLDHMGKSIEAGTSLENDWNTNLSTYKDKYPEDAKKFAQMISGELPKGWEDTLPTYGPEDKGMATRALSGIAINALAAKLDSLIGGSADLAPSNLTLIKSSGDFQKNQYQNRNIRFGVREHAMGAICNGIALHSNALIPYCATFLVFVDYMRNAIRMSALSKAGVLYVMSHDSVAVGEDGPTHQPVEHIASLRLIPNLAVIRPADGNEVSGAYMATLKNRTRPAVIATSRQNVNNVAGTSADAAQKGAYILSDCEGTPELIIIGTGTELGICAEAAEKLTEGGKKIRVVSMPSWELFEDQTPEYKESVLPGAIQKRLVVEAGCSFGWERYFGTEGKMISIDVFGRSGPGATCLEKMGYTTDNVIAYATSLL